MVIKSDAHLASILEGIHLLINWLFFLWEKALFCIKQAFQTSMPLLGIKAPSKEQHTDHSAKVNNSFIISTEGHVFPGRMSRYGESVIESLNSATISKAEVYIGIEGPIGVGKTTLTKILKKKWKADVLYEDFRANPFLADFYVNRDYYAFYTQLFFLFNRYYQLRGVHPQNRPLVSDYTFLKDNIFACLNLSENELGIYQGLYNVLEDQILKPDLVIYLKASVNSLMNRIDTRGRAIERNIDRVYIEKVSEAYEAFFSAYNTAPVLIVDTTKVNIVKNPKDQATILEQIESTIIDKILKKRP